MAVLSLFLLSAIFQAFPVAAQPTTDFVKLIATSEPPASRPAVTPVQPLTTAAPSKPGPTLVKVSTFFNIAISNIISVYNIWTRLDKPCAPPRNSKASRRRPRRRAAVRRAKSPNPGWRSSSTTSTFPPTKSRRPVRHPWTLRMLDYCSSSSCFSSCRSSASNSSTTTTRLYYQHPSSTHTKHYPYHRVLWIYVFFSGLFEKSNTHFFSRGLVWLSSTTLYLRTSQILLFSTGQRAISLFPTTTLPLIILITHRMLLHSCCFHECPHSGSLARLSLNCACAQWFGWLALLVWGAGHRTGWSAHIGNRFPLFLSCLSLFSLLFSVIPSFSHIRFLFYCFTCNVVEMISWITMTSSYFMSLLSLQTCGRGSDQRRQQLANLHRGVFAHCTSASPCGISSSSPKQLAVEPQARSLACQPGGDEGIWEPTCTSEPFALVAWNSVPQQLRNQSCDCRLKGAITQLLKLKLITKLGHVFNTSLKTQTMTCPVIQELS